MGRVVTFAQLPAESAGDGIDKAPITRGDTTEMAAEFIRVAPGGKWAESAPRGSDCYLFALNGAAAISAGGGRHQLAAQTFATLEEGVEFTIANDGPAPAEIVKVLAPPRPSGLAGFRGNIRVAERERTPVVDLPAEKKKRIYFVGHDAAQSERGHAMIVVYEKSTVTGLHHHPNAESMFVVLTGALQFTVNGAPVVVKPGQAAYFGMNDQHGLHVADGHTGASFLEFHIPAAFTTVRASQARAS
jgi:mannose-6-phosphate isomerase-like protein (cupin superfamily)